MSRSFPLRRLFLLALIVAVAASASAVLPGRAQSDDGTGLLPKTLVSSDIPTQVFPTFVVPIKRIVYLWTSVSGATQYQLQVYQDATVLLNATYAASVCVSGTCAVRHDIDLSNGAYMWRVRAMVGGVWMTFSPYQAFTVSVEVTGFYSPFTSNALDWVVHKGLWYLEGANYFTTVGVAGRASTISHLNNYSTLTYEVRMKRTGCNGCANVIAIRGNPTLDATGWWNSEYTFDYTNSGLFSVWRDYNGTYTALKNWTSTAAINPGGWNTLKVTANGSTLNFYINGVWVWSGYDTSYASGRVGIGMYRNGTSTGNKLWVDYAQLDTTVVSPSTMEMEGVMMESGAEVSGGNRNMAP
jgi:hypothetical protein